MPDEVEVFTSVLRALASVGILSDLIVVGGWAQHLYRHYFDDPPELSALRTLDIDILFSRPPAIHPRGDLEETLKAIGFQRDFTADGSTKFISRDVEIEFLVPDRGKGDTGPYRIKELAIAAQSLRLVDVLTAEPITVQYGGHSVRVPNPIRFCFHKLLVSERREKDAKREKDRTTAFELAALLFRLPEWRDRLVARFEELSPKQRAVVRSLLDEKGSAVASLLHSLPSEKRN